MDLSKIRHVQTNDPVSAEVTSQPTRAIEIRLKELEDLVTVLSAANNNSKLILPNVAIRTDSPNPVTLWSAVYFNPQTGLYELAAANVTVLSGVFVANPSALAVGLVCAVRGGFADVMIGGMDYWGVDPDRSAMLNELIVEGDSGFNPGSVYYLSDTNPGMLTRFPPSLKIQVLVASDASYIVQPIYATPDAIENIYSMPVGMRPVGSVRALPPDGSQVAIVGFDALEQFDSTNDLWRSTADSVVSTYQNFGYMLADATVTTQPAAPVYVRLQVGTDGVIKVFSASTLATLINDGGSTFHALSGGVGLAALTSGNYATARAYEVQDPSGTVLGTLSFAFTAYDVSVPRHVIFRFPDHFQGWKSSQASIAPAAVAHGTSGVITSVIVTEGSVGFLTPPEVVFSGGGGSSAAATAVINEFGTISAVIITDGGSGYTSAPDVSFVSRVTAATVLSAGGGATATLTIGSGVVTATAVTAGGAGYGLAPMAAIIDPLGSGQGAHLMPLVYGGVVTDITVVTGGSGYSSGTFVRLLPNLNNQYTNASVTGQLSPLVGITNQTTTAALTPIMSEASITAVEVLSGGSGYAGGITAVASSGTDGSINILVDATGQITGVIVLDPGTGFTAVPDLSSVTTGGLASGNGAKLQVLLGSTIQSLNISDDGTGDISYPAVAQVGTPLLRIDAVNGGSGYTAQPTVTVAMPDLGTAQATATARIGGTVSQILITNGGTGYTPATTTVSIAAPDVGAAAVIKPIFSSTTLIGIQIIDPGWGYVTAPAITISGDGSQAAATALIQDSPLSPVVGVNITDAGLGYGATTSATVTAPASGTTATVALALDAYGSISRVVITNPGSGYILPPVITVNDSGSAGVDAVLTAIVNGTKVVGFDITDAGTGYVTSPVCTVTPADARGTGVLADAKLATDGSQILIGVSGGGGSRSTKLQLSNYETDFPSLNRPVDAPFYYNVKADPDLAARYPAIPIDKVSFMFNGVELRTTTYNEGTCLLTNPDADVAVTRRSLLWSTSDNEGAPWDFSYSAYVYDQAATGRDCIIPDTGATSDTCWRLWDQTFRYEIQRNQAWIHLNKASRYAQTGRIQSLATLAPLRLIDMATGASSNNDGVPMSGQLLLVDDSADATMAGTGQQLNLTKPGELQPILINNTGRPVVISSVLLQVVFQTSAAGTAPDATFCARVTIGTQVGNYADIVGSSAADVFATRLYAMNQVKEIFPDADQPSPVIQPNQVVYLRVVQPAGSPIVTQMAVARIKGTVL
jgi:hypothetical protein